MWKGERFREKLARWRGLADLSQADLDEALGTSKGYVAQLETRDRDYDGDPEHDGRSRLTPPGRKVCEKIQATLEHGVTVERRGKTKHKGGGLRLAPDEVWTHAARERLHDADPELQARFDPGPTLDQASIGTFLRGWRLDFWKSAPDELDRVMNVPEGTWLRIEAGELPAPSRSQCARVDEVDGTPPGTLWGMLVPFRAGWFDQDLAAWVQDRDDRAEADEDPYSDAERGVVIGLRETASPSVAEALSQALDFGRDVDSRNAFMAAIELLARVPSRRAGRIWRRIEFEARMALGDAERAAAEVDRLAEELRRIDEQHQAAQLNLAGIMSSQLRFTAQLHVSRQQVVDVGLHVHALRAQAAEGGVDAKLAGAEAALAHAEAELRQAHGESLNLEYARDRVEREIARLESQRARVREQLAVARAEMGESRQASLFDDKPPPF